MQKDLVGDHALVCGGSQGIGAAAALRLARAGASVTILARDRDRSTALVDSLDRSAGNTHHVLLVDMADTAALHASVTAHLAAHGPVHILVNNTGGPAPGPAHLAPVEAYEQAFRLHLLAYQTLVLATVPGMQAAGRGRIVNVISTSVKAPLHNLGVSNTIRGAVAQWAKTLATELGPSGITVNNVLPGATATERLAGIIRNSATRAGITEEEVADRMRQEIPLRRFARPDEVAAAILFLAGPDGSYINGINLPVDGGRTPTL